MERDVKIDGTLVVGGSRWVVEGDGVGGSHQLLKGWLRNSVQWVGEAMRASTEHVTRQEDTKAGEDRGNWGGRSGAKGVCRWRG